jgi:DNA polymerase-3 subunit beta
MQFTLSRKEVVDNAPICKALSGRKSNISSTNDIKLTVKGDKLTIVATDLGSTFICEHNVSGAMDGEICVNGGKFFDIMAMFPIDEINASVDKNLLKIQNEEVLFSLPSRSTDMFVDVPDVSNGKMFSCPASIFKTIISNMCMVSVANGENRAHLNGVMLQECDGYLQFVSTDIGRLVLNKLENHDCVLSEDRHLIPKRALSEVLKTLNKIEYVSFGVVDNCFIVQTPKGKFITSLLLGQFPKIEQLLKTIEGLPSVLVEKSSFLASIERAGIMTDITSSANFIFEEDVITLKNLTQDSGIFEEKYQCVEGDVPSVDTVLNGQYIYDAIKVIPGENARIFIKNAETAFFITDEENSGFTTCLIMPARA